MFLAFDTETTGLPDWGKPSDSPQQPHLVQLAMILLADDHSEQACVSLIIRPDGWEIPDEVAAIHGITTQHALKHGVPEKQATDLFVSLMYGIPGVTAIGHNVKFDHRIMRIAMLRAGYSKEQQDLFKVESYCTMESTKLIVNLPPAAKMLAAGFNKPKPPKLEECIAFFFNEKLEGAHDALVDVRASVRVWRHMNTPPPASVADVGDVV